jgi:hypothetical protein
MLEYVIGALHKERRDVMLRKRKEAEMTFYKARIVRHAKNEVQHDIETDAELRKMLQQSRIAIQENRVFSTEDLLDAIDRGDI